MQTNSVCPCIVAVFFLQLPNSESFDSITTADSLRALGDLAQKVLNEVLVRDVCVCVCVRACVHTCLSMYACAKWPLLCVVSTSGHIGPNCRGGTVCCGGLGLSGDVSCTELGAARGSEPQE